MLKAGAGGPGSSSGGEEVGSRGYLETEDRQDGCGLGHSWVVGPSSTREAAARPLASGGSVGGRQIPWQ